MGQVCIDFKAYGLFGFQREWEPVDKTPRAEIFSRMHRTAKMRALDAVVVASMSDGLIPKGSSNDRFGVLYRQASDDSRSKDLVVMGQENIAFFFDGVYYINGQVVQTPIEGEERVLVVGSNDFVPKLHPPGDILYEAKKEGLVTIAEPELLTRAGREFLTHNSGLVDAVLAFNSERAVPAVFGFGPLYKHSVNQGDDAAKFAESMGRPAVYGSSAHRPEYIGLAFSEITADLRPEMGERDLLRAISRGLEETPVNNYGSSINFPFAMWRLKSDWNKGMAIRKSYEDRGKVSPI